MPAGRRAAGHRYADDAALSGDTLMSTRAELISPEEDQLRPGLALLDSEDTVTEPGSSFRDDSAPRSVKEQNRQTPAGLSAQTGATTLSSSIK